MSRRPPISRYSALSIALHITGAAIVLGMSAPSDTDRPVPIRLVAGIPEASDPQPESTSETTVPEPVEVEDRPKDRRPAPLEKPSPPDPTPAPQEQHPPKDAQPAPKPKPAERPTEPAPPEPEPETREPEKPKPTPEPAPKPQQAQPEETPEPIPAAPAATSTDQAWPAARGSAAQTTEGREAAEAAYLANVQREIRRHFRPPTGSSGDLSIRFTITRDGKAIRLSFTNRSGNALLDIAGMSAIEEASVRGRFGPIPADIGRDELTITFDFKQSGV